MATEKIPRKMVASRICDAIAAIGYTNYSAIMDIIDNSISAEAKNVTIQFFTEDLKNFSDRSNVSSVRIIDDGRGMNHDQLLAALDIGSIQTYPENSLSKYGFGLKSAGFSLGPKISLISRQYSKTSSVISVDKRTLGEEYIIEIDEKGDLVEAAATYLTGSSGTIVDISGCQDKNHDSAKRTIDILIERLGVTYSYFLSRKADPLTITIKCTGKPDIKVTPKDILHIKDCISEFNKDTYDCLRPILRKRVQIDVSVNTKIPPLDLEIVLFPPAKIRQLPGISPEDKTRLGTYDISRKNKGFFIYRNDRLIRWADDLDGIIGKDDIIIRGRIRLTTEHDDIMHVDVSKQNMFIPDDIIERIEREVRIPLREAEDIHARCKELLAADEGLPFNLRNQDLAPQDDEPPHNAEGKAEARRRRQRLAQETQEKLAADGEISEPIGAVRDTDVPLFQRVRYSDKVGITLWEMGEDATEGTFVRINTNHSFYRTVLAHLPEDAPARQAIEGMLWCSAIAEAISLEHITDLDQRQIERVLQKFKKVFSNNIDTWCGINQDLFGSM